MASIAKQEIFFITMFYKEKKYLCGILLTLKGWGYFTNEKDGPSVYLGS
jgi:hypothetical protein